MSAPNAAAPPPPRPAPTRDEQDVTVARKMFFAGCAFLPWLWIMCLLHFRSRLWDKEAPAALRWYLRAQLIGLVIVTVGFIAWVVSFQQQWRSWGSIGANMLVYAPNQAQWWLDDGT